MEIKVLKIYGNNHHNKNQNIVGFLTNSSVFIFNYMGAGIVYGNRTWPCQTGYLYVSGSVEYQENLCTNQKVAETFHSVLLRGYLILQLQAEVGSCTLLLTENRLERGFSQIWFCSGKKHRKEIELVSRRNNEFAFCFVNVKLRAEHWRKILYYLAEEG